VTNPQPVYNRQVPDRTMPYLTRDQYRCSPTAMDTQSLIRGGQQADQDAELDRIIRQASGWCDGCAEQPLTAQATTEPMRVPVSSDRTMRLHPRQHPVVAVTGISFGPDPANLSALADLSSVWVENQSVIAPMTSLLAGGWTGPLQFGTARPGSRVFVSLSYVAGYGVTVLSGPLTGVETVIPVRDVTGFMPGQQVRVEQGGAPSGVGSGQTPLTSSTAVVASVDPVAGTVTVSKPIGSAYAAGAAFTAMPEEVEQACIYVVTGLLKQRGAGALVMKGGNAATVKRDGEEPGAEEFDSAEAILALYRPVVP
jgi:hypothetical protein